MRLLGDILQIAIYTSIQIWSEKEEHKNGIFFVSSAFFVSPVSSVSFASCLPCLILSHVSFSRNDFFSQFHGFEKAFLFILLIYDLKI